MISYTLCNEDNYYTIKKTLPETEGCDETGFFFHKFAFAAFVYGFIMFQHGLRLRCLSHFQILPHQIPLLLSCPREFPHLMFSLFSAEFSLLYNNYLHCTMYKIS